VPDDPEQASFEAKVNERVQKLTMDVFDYADGIMRAGTAKTKNDFIKQVFPALMRSLRDEEVDSELDVLKTAQQIIFQKLAEGDPGPLPARPDIPDILPDDSPAANQPGTVADRTQLYR
jgi:hypothetical protein